VTEPGQASFSRRRLLAGSGLATATALGLLGLACAPGLTKGQVVSWMDAKAGTPDLEVAGSWESPNSYLLGGWGSGTWIQKGSLVSGTLGPYNIEGRVVGKKVYLAIFNGERIYFTAILEPTKEGGLGGMAISKALADAEGARMTENAPIALVRPKS